jgi:hypothetical protein
MNDAMITNPHGGVQEVFWGRCFPAIGAASGGLIGNTATESYLRGNSVSMHCSGNRRRQIRDIVPETAALDSDARLLRYSGVVPPLPTHGRLTFPIGT